MAEDTNKGQTRNPDQQCYTDSTPTQDPGEYYRNFVRDPRTVFSPAPQMPDPVRGLSDNLDQLCYPSEAPMSIQSYIPEDSPLTLPVFGIEGPLDLCKWIPDLCDKLPKTFSVNFDGAKPCLVVEGNDCYDPTEWDFQPNSCIQDAIDCIFKPFSAQGGWLPTANDCDTFYPPGFQRNTNNQTCVMNCVPDRIGVYEWRYNGSDAKDYYYTVDPSETPSGYVRSRSLSYGGSVTSIYIALGQSGGIPTQSDWQPLVIDKTYINKAGDNYWNTLPSKKFEGKFRLGTKGCVIEMIIAAKKKNNQWDTRYVFKGFENKGDGYYPGEVYELRSFDASNTLLGYIQINEVYNQEPNFYILRSPSSNASTVPLYSFYSSSRVDSLLTTNPTAEIDRIGNGSYADRGIIGYVLKNKENIDEFLCEDETPYPLYRYYQSAAAGGGNKYIDHRYSIIPLATNESFKPRGKKLYYKLPNTPLQPLIIRYKSNRGTAGKKSSWGYYFANEAGIPQVGYILRKNMTDSFSHGQIEITIATLQNYPGGYLGFFLIPGGNADSNISDGSMVTFTQATVYTNQVGYRAYYNGNLVYARAGQSGNSGGGENYCFFSDTQLNPYQKQWTRWNGKIQGWEDWYGGDEDYDDVKINYNVKWKDGSTYTDEGVQCYVFRNDVLPKLYITSTIRTGCEADRLFKKAFLDPILKRLGCGSTVDGTYLAGTCTGSYVVQLNCDQTITCRMPGLISLRAWGIDVSDFKETSWRMRFTLNGEYILDEVYSAVNWPKKGRVLHPAFEVSEGDQLRFELLEIQSGSPNGFVLPKLSIYDETNQIHESVMSITINTKSLDDTSYTTSVANDGTGIKQLRLQSKDDSTYVTGWDNDATQTSLIVNEGDDLWRKLSKDDRNNILYQRVIYTWAKQQKDVFGPLNALIQIKVEPIMGSNNRYQTKVTVEQMTFKGRGFAVGDTLDVEWPSTMYVGSTRVPDHSKFRFKLKVTGVN